MLIVVFRDSGTVHRVWHGDDADGGIEDAIRRAGGHWRDTIAHTLSVPAAERVDLVAVAAALRALADFVDGVRVARYVDAETSWAFGLESATARNATIRLICAGCARALPPRDYPVDRRYTSRGACGPLCHTCDQRRVRSRHTTRTPRAAPT